MLATLQHKRENYRGKAWSQEPTKSRKEFLTNHGNKSVEHGYQEKPNKNANEQIQPTEHTGIPHEECDEKGKCQRNTHKNVDPYFDVRLKMTNDTFLRGEKPEDGYGCA